MEMRKFYIEILHPYETRVLWHYFMEAPSAEAAKEAARKKFLIDEMNGLLLETGGLFLLTCEEDK